MAAYYNEIDKFAAAWLRELIKAGLIADGEVDERSIAEVTADDVRGFTQCHFFAGIGGWSYALRLAGWPDDREVWTGSCPCQPFSSAGAQVGGDDARHLWPTWFRLIAECRPVVVFGEQVESAIGHGWVDLVCDDLEREGYAAGACGLPAASVGAFHVRQRVYFVADAAGARRERAFGESEGEARHEARMLVSGAGGELGNAGLARSQRPGIGRDGADQLSPWAPGLVDWIPCTDDKSRPVEPGTFPLADGVPARVGRLRGYGNSIVPQVAQVFIESYLDCEREQ